MDKCPNCGSENPLPCHRIEESFTERKVVLAGWYCSKFTGGCGDFIKAIGREKQIQIDKK